MTQSNLPFFKANQIEIIKISPPHKASKIEEFLCGVIYCKLIRLLVDYDPHKFTLTFKKEVRDGIDKLIIICFSDEPKDSMYAFRDLVVDRLPEIGVIGLEVFDRSRIRLFGMNIIDQYQIAAIAEMYVNYWLIRKVESDPEWDLYKKYFPVCIEIKKALDVMLNLNSQPKWNRL